jgi:hypothetical protein
MPINAVNLSASHVASVALKHTSIFSAIKLINLLQHYNFLVLHGTWILAVANEHG